MTRPEVLNDENCEDIVKTFITDHLKWTGTACTYSVPIVLVICRQSVHVDVER